MRAVASTLLLLAAALPQFAAAQEIQFVESFALSQDRGETLKQLIPGTEEFYFFHCLHYQNTQQFDRAAETLKAWIGRHKRTAQAQLMERRQALLTYSQQPQATLAHIRESLSLQLNHQRRRLGEKPNLPSTLDPTLISRERLQAAALLHPNVSRFEASALRSLVAVPLDPVRRRALLARLERPDIDGLVELIADDLERPDSGGFGSLKIHNMLLLSQLDQLLKRKPELRNHVVLVRAYTAKLRPAADESWQSDPRVQLDYLERIWKFVSPLGPVHNSLKAHVLYHRLDYDRAHGVWDKQRFLAYLRLPRNAGYINPDYMKRDESRRFPAQLQQDFPETPMPPVADDQPLVRDYFLHFFVEENSYESYLPLVQTGYLKHVFAEAKAVNGLGEPEQWASLLPPATYQSLKDRVDLDFDPLNKKVFGPDEPVSLDVHVKNVSQLIVKVFHINARNYYRQTLREVNTDIELDGLVANEEQTIDYDSPALRRVKRHFQFPQLTKPGVYVIDLIGSGRSSRVVIRKGQLRPLVRLSAYGQAVTVIDEQDQVVDDAVIWFGGKIYSPADNGEILLPYSTSPSQGRAVVIQRGDESHLARLPSPGESYRLAAGMVVDRESLRTRRTAKLLIRPQLTLNGAPIDLSLLKDASLTITSKDRDGVPTTLQTDKLELSSSEETVYEFQTPPRLAGITFRLAGEVEVASNGGRKVSVADQQSFAVNGIEAAEQIGDVHLAWIDNAYAIDLLGRTGEPLADRAVHVELKHRDFTTAVHVSLQSDAQGRVELGALSGIAWVKARHEGGTQRQWTLAGEHASLPSVVHAAAGDTVEIPMVRGGGADVSDKLSLLEVREGRFVSDQSSRVKIDGGLLKIGKLPAGDFDLLIEPTGQRVVIKVTAAKAKQAGYAVGANRQLELRPAPMSIGSAQVKGDKLVVQLQNAGDHSRVHLLATRYMPAFSAHAALSRIGSAPLRAAASLPRRSLYMEGRSIGDEYDYIIRRQYAAKFAGNMLDRPSLLLNPWALRSTSTGRQDAGGADKFAPAPDPSAERPKATPTNGPTAWSVEDFATFDWIPGRGVVLENLKCDEDGRLEAPLDMLGGAQHVRIVAVDPRGVVQRRLSLQDSDGSALDLRLVDGLDPKSHFTQHKKVTVTASGDEFLLRGADSARFERYDSLRRVFTLLETLRKDSRMDEFRFVLDWPKLKDEEKREKYSNFASHELSFFLMHKDLKFFNAVVRPHLKSKKDKTFLDQWLLEQSLTPHLGAWRHGQLNVVERILLGRRIEAEFEAAARHVEELTTLVPPDLDKLALRFDTAVLSMSLANNDNDGDGKLRLGSNASEHLIRQRNRQMVELHDLAQADAPSIQALGLRLQGQNGAIKEELKKLDRLVEKQRDFSENNKLSSLRQSASRSSRRYFDDRAKLFGQAADSAPAQLYRVLDKTQEWAENNYYHLPIEAQGPDLVTANRFWNDYAHHQGDKPFLSRHLTEAAGSFTECLLALAVLDLPFESPEHKTTFDADTMKIVAGGPLIVFHEEVESVEPAGEAPILVSQNLFRQGDRYRFENNERLDKFVSDEFLTHTAYGCQIVVTNPSSAPRKLDLLLQIPEGAMPLAGGKATRSVSVQLQPFNTQTVEYLFYFPQTGEYQHFPVHVCTGRKLLASAEPQTLQVVESLSKIDRESWAFISQNGSPDDVLEYLRGGNLQRTELDLIAFRMADEKFFRAVTQLLVKRHVYSHTLWSYSLKHDVAERIREFLQHENEFVVQCGPYLDSPLLTIDPVIRKTYQHLDYRPLVNARAHKLGQQRSILNNRFNEQYHALMNVLAFRPALDNDDQMSTVYYLLLQDRVGEALKRFEAVDAGQLETKLQHDYFTAYLCFYTGELQSARDIAARYADYPVDRWRKAFNAVQAQLDELETGEVQVADDQDRNQQQTKQADQAPSFDFKVEDGQVQLSYQRVAEASVNYYLMDIELLFSRNPFVKRFSGQFSHIFPNHTATVKLEDQPRGTAQWKLPKELDNKNVLVEITAGGVTKAQPFYSHSMTVQLIERFGQLRVSRDNGQPLSKAYVKVYAQMKDGSIRFYKDGYTDLRGRFDYSSLNTNELEQVGRFSVLVLTKDHGAIVREATPPAR